jgi:hypothetical protein
MKKLLIFLLSILTLICHAKEVTIIKSNRKKNDKTGEVTYKYVSVSTTKVRDTYICKDPGDEQCRAYYVQIPGGNGICNPPNPEPIGGTEVCSIEQLIISRISNGESSGDGTFDNGFTYTYSEGRIDKEGVVSYTLTINDNRK